MSRSRISEAISTASALVSLCIDITWLIILVWVVLHPYEFGSLMIRYLGGLMCAWIDYADGCMY